MLQHWRSLTLSNTLPTPFYTHLVRRLHGIHHLDGNGMAAQRIQQQSSTEAPCLCQTPGTSTPTSSPTCPHQGANTRTSRGVSIASIISMAMAWPPSAFSSTAAPVKKYWGALMTAVALTTSSGHSLILRWSAKP